MALISRFRKTVKLSGGGVAGRREARPDCLGFAMEYLNETGVGKPQLVSSSYLQCHRKRTAAEHFEGL